MPPHAASSTTALSPATAPPPPRRMANGFGPTAVAILGAARSPGSPAALSDLCYLTSRDPDACLSLVPHVSALFSLGQALSGSGEGLEPLVKVRAAGALPGALPGCCCCARSCAHATATARHAGASGPRLRPATPAPSPSLPAACPTRCWTT
jgi:hypothetical protein